MESPFFSIIVPTYMRHQQLKACLKSLSLLEYPRDRFEVIVVNDGDSTLLDAELAPYQDSLNIRLIFQKNGGPASARNTGARHAVGAFLAFTDDDCQPHPHWLKHLANYHQQYPHHALGGQVINGLPNNLYATASQLHGDAVYDYYNRSYGSSSFLASCNFSVPLKQYQQLGGFDMSFPLAAAEDRDFCDRWLKQGYAMAYIPEAVVTHAHPLSWLGFVQQHFNYGRGAFFFHRARANNPAEDRVKTDLKFYWHVVTYPFGKAPVLKAAALAALFVLCNVCKTVGFYWERLGQFKLSTKSPKIKSARAPEREPNENLSVKPSADLFSKNSL